MTILPSGPSGARLAAVLLLSAVPALAAQTEKPEAFVRRVYAQYRTGGPGVPMQRPGGAAFYAAPLLDAFAKDLAISNGEVGAIDSDPICGCQDYENLRVGSVKVAPGGADIVTAQVAFVNLGSHHTVTLTLTRTPAGWRIADVGDATMKSVMAVLQDEIAHPIAPSPPGPSSPSPAQP